MLIDHFTMNGDFWKVYMVDYQNPKLVDRTGTLTVATTDPETMTVYLSDTLYGDFLMTVFIHELGHCALYSFHLISKIRRMTYPEYWIDMEEFICNVLADYGTRIFQIAYQTFGYEAWKILPGEIEKFIA